MAFLGLGVPGWDFKGVESVLDFLGLGVPAWVLKSDMESVLHFLGLGVPGWVLKDLCLFGLGVPLLQLGRSDIASKEVKS